MSSSLLKLPQFSIRDSLGALGGHKLNNRFDKYGNLVGVWASAFSGGFRSKWVSSIGFLPIVGLGFGLVVLLFEQDVVFLPLLVL